MELLLDVTASKQQLAVLIDRVSEVQQKIHELREKNSDHHRIAQERMQAEQIMDGLDPITIQSPMTSLQIKHSIAVLENSLAELQSRVGQAHSALRSAKVTRLQELLAESKERYDDVAKELLNAYLEVSELAQALESATRVNQLPMSWHRLAIPRGVEDGHLSRYDGGMVCQPGSDLRNTPAGLSARNSVRALLEKEGIQ